MNLFMDAHFWEALCIVILVSLIYKPCKNLISNGLKAHSNSVRNELKRSEELLSNAEKTHQFYKKQHAKFSDIAKEIENNVELNVKKITKTYEEKLQKQMEAKKNIHIEKKAVYKKRELDKVNASATYKALAISQMYLEEHTFGGVQKEKQIKEALNLIKDEKVILH